MPINIEPLHIDSLNCLEDLIVSVASWLERRYELMFIESWQFNFKKTVDQTSLSFGLRIPQFDDNSYNNLSKYHGIYIERYEPKSAEKALEYINSQLSLQKPVLIYIDSYYCPWHKQGYQNYHSRHYCLVVGSDSSNLYCIDSTPINFNACLPIELYSQGWGLCMSFSIDNENTQNFDWKNNIYTTINSNNENNIFDEIRLFGEQMTQTVDLSFEIQGYEKNCWDSPLMGNILAFGDGRGKFAKVLKYLNEKNNIPEFIYLSQELEKSRLIWYTIRQMLAKACIMPNTKNIMMSIKNKFIEVADLEENVTNSILEICSKPSNYIKSTLKNVQSNIKFDDYLFLDLSKYFNNKGFGTFSLQCIADLTGSNEYYLSESLPEEKIWHFDELLFSFPDISDRLNDNISCSGQNIKLSKEKYNKIMILGCAEWGDYCDKMTIEYIDNTREEKFIEFTDWSSDEPVFGEKIMWIGQGAKGSAGQVQQVPAKLKIYSQCYYLKKDIPAISLTLPTCPHMHIFAITLTKD